MYVNTKGPAAGGVPLSATGDRGRTREEADRGGRWISEDVTPGLSLQKSGIDQMETLLHHVAVEEVYNDGRV